MDTEKLVENKLLTVAGRIAIIVATACLPVLGTLGGKFAYRILDKLDSVSEKVDDQNLKLQLLDQTMQFGFRETKADLGNVRIQLSDHEGRIRLIERATPIPR